MRYQKEKGEAQICRRDLEHKYGRSRGMKKRALRMQLGGQREMRSV